MFFLINLDRKFLIAFNQIIFIELLYFLKSDLLSNLFYLEFRIQGNHFILFNIPKINMSLTYYNFKSMLVKSNKYKINVNNHRQKENKCYKNQNIIETYLC